jgi:hypothetical protein
MANLMPAFRACPVPDGRRLGGLPWIEISQSLGGQSSLVVGKNAGSFAESALFCEHPSRKHLRIQAFADEFPMRSSRELFDARRELLRARREFRAKSIRAFRHIQSEKVRSQRWIKNTSTEDYSDALLNPYDF